MDNQDFKWCKKVIKVGVNDFLLIQNKLFVELQIDIDGEDNYEYKWIDLKSVTNEEKLVEKFRAEHKTDSTKLKNSSQQPNTKVNVN